MATDEAWLRRAFELARRAGARGDAPFEAVLVAADGRVLGEGENTATTTGDPTAHAELELVRKLAGQDPSAFAGATIYASGEPCPMCAAAIAWRGIGRVVYSVPSPRLAELLRDRPGPSFSLRAQEVLGKAAIPVSVVGPLLPEEGEQVFEDPTEVQHS